MGLDEGICGKVAENEVEAERVDPEPAAASAPRGNAKPAPPRVAALVSVAALSGGAGAAVLGLSDFAITAMRLSHARAVEVVWLAVGTTTTLITLGTVVGAVYGAGLCPVLRWVRIRRRPKLTWWLQAALASLPLAALSLWVVLSWVIPHWEELGPGARAAGVATAAVAVVGCVAVTGAVLTLRGRYDGEKLARGHWIATALCLGMLVTTQMVDHFALVGLYEYAHAGLGVAALVAAALLARLLWRTLEVAGHARLMRRVLLTIAGLGIGGAVALDAAALESPYLQRTTVTAKARSTMRAAFDWDGDGFSSVLDGGDCDDSDRQVAPTAFEVPGNGIDDNCAAGDAAWPEPDDVPPPSQAKPRKLNVVMFFLEATRADHVGAHGYGRDTTPNIDRLASDALVFNRAHAQITKTFYSLPSVFLSRYPSNIPRDPTHPSLRGTRAYMYVVPPTVPWLPELLREAGYQTFGFSYTRVPFVQGLERGLDVHYHGRGTTRKALAKLKRKRKDPFFLFVFCGYPHYPYRKRGGFDFGDRAIDRYDSEIAQCDAEFGQITRWLRKRRLYDKTMVIVAADHGEEFGEHGGQYHGARLYEELLHVPLVVRIPGGPAGEVDTPVELVDITPTVLEVLGIGRGDEHFDGQSLLSALGRTESRPAYAELGPNARVSRAWITDRYKVIVDAERARVELYDLQEDPGESLNLARRLPEVSAALRESADMRGLESQLSIVATARRGHLPPKSLRYLRRPGVLLQVLAELRPPVSEELRSELHEVASRYQLGPELCRELARLGVKVKGRKHVCAEPGPIYDPAGPAFPQRNRPVRRRP